MSRTPDFPPGLNGGVPQDQRQGRMGETNPRSPDEDSVDPGQLERDLERPEPPKQD
ncbi:hypothetical protein [Ideonella sp. BN130291]|uniref:hypothetical protein n=1 Tax=Ideonella sp. BN130291 TaxID=3112940 RepID=UPI002E25B2E4|nr:hypothetical protein [Ideonella sp. BN130291]